LPRKSQKIDASVNASGQARRARDVSNTVDELDQVMNSVAKDAQEVYRKHAPRRSGRLQRGIRVVPAGESIVLTAKAVDPQSGYDYVAVSRLGHRKRYIFPVHKSGRKAGQPRSALSSRRGKSGQFITRGPGYLKFRSRGKLWYLIAVRGFRPKSDWAKDAAPEVKAIADAGMKRTGNKITTRWGGSG
jgi:hypothetical protein